jgi:hypothetical protein
MTPWNIVGMARVKGLDMIAITGHNSAQNVRQALLAGEAYGVTVVPGMEVTSREETHLLAYFSTLEADMAFGSEIYACLPDVRNRDELFGNQLMSGDGDEPVGKIEKLLLNAVSLNADEISRLAERHGGFCVPAHINRGANGMIGALGLMPPLPRYPVVEVAEGLPCADYATRGRRVLRSSDAHRLEDIAERCFALTLRDGSAAGLLAWLQNR